MRKLSFQKHQKDMDTLVFLKQLKISVVAGVEQQSVLTPRDNLIVRGLDIDALIFLKIVSLTKDTQIKAYIQVRTMELI